MDGVKGTDPSTVTNAEATIKIRDVNDEPPSFNKREYFIQIPENISEGSALPSLDMVVTDPDEVSISLSLFQPKSRRAPRYQYFFTFVI